MNGGKKESESKKAKREVSWGFRYRFRAQREAVVRTKSTGQTRPATLKR